MVEAIFEVGGRVGPQQKPEKAEKPPVDREVQKAVSEVAEVVPDVPRAITDHPAPSGGSVQTPSGGNVRKSTGGGKPVLEDKTKSISEELAGSLPMPPSERGPEKEHKESGSAVVGKTLAPQLLSAPEFLIRQQIDERKLAVLNDYMATSLNYFSFRGYVDDVRFWAWFVDAELVTSQAIDGLARRHALRAIEAASGAQVTEQAEKPGVLSRNIWDRSWKKKALRRGQKLPPDEVGEE